MIIICLIVTLIIIAIILAIQLSWFILLFVVAKQKIQLHRYILYLAWLFMEEIIDNYLCLFFDIIYIVIIFCALNGAYCWFAVLTSTMCSLHYIYYIDR